MQDENGDWKLDPAYEEYYKSLEGRTDNSSASKQTDNATKSSVKSSNKEPAHVKDLNKKNSEGKGKNPLYIPYGEADQLNSNREGKKNNDKKPKMPSAKTPRPRPLEYEDGWYEEPSDGQWYNTYDWYEDENGEWAYDYRMEEYGYIQLETGEWVPGPGAAEADQQVPSLSSGKTEPGQSKSSDSMGALRGGLGSIFGGGKAAQANSTKAVGDAKPNGSLPQNGATNTNVSKAGQGKEGKAASKDGFSRLFSSEDPSSATQKTSLPPRPPDYDDYWYQAEDGNWYNEYDDLGYQFADDEILSVATDGKAELSRVSKVSKSDPKPAQAVPKPASVGSAAKKKPPRPADYEDRYYQDEKGAWRNEYDDRGLEFDDGGDFYSEKELADAEKDLFKNGPKASDNKRTVAKANDSVKAVDTTKPVIEKSELVKKAEPAKEVVKVVPSESGKGSTSSDIPVSSTKSRSGDTGGPRIEASKPKKLPRPADYEDQWYQASDGQWYNEYDDTGQEYEDSASDISVTESKRSFAKNVSFEQQSRGSAAAGGRVSPRQRWQWAYSRILQVGVRVRSCHCWISGHHVVVSHNVCFLYSCNSLHILMIVFTKAKPCDKETRSGETEVQERSPSGEQTSSNHKRHKCKCKCKCGAEEQDQQQHCCKARVQTFSEGEDRCCCESFTSSCFSSCTDTSGGCSSSSC